MDDVSKKLVLNLPFRTKTEKIEAHAKNEITGCIEEEFSMSYLNVLGYSIEDKDEIFTKLKKFEIQRSFSVRLFYSWFEEYIERMGYMLTGKNKKGTFFSTKCYMEVKECSIKKETSMLNHFEKWRVGKSTYKKTYVSCVYL